MISKKKQQDFVRKRWESILHHFGQFVKRTNAEDMHKIRVDLKKLRALVYFQEQAGNTISGKEKKLLRKLFRQAGKIREAQVSAQLLKKQRIKSAPVYTHLRNTVAEESKKFVALVRRDLGRIVTLNTKLWKHVERVPGKTAQRILDELQVQVRSYYKPRMKVNGLHASRKSIKRFIYMNGFVSKDEPPGSVTARMKKLEEAIGNWHDTLVTIGLLKQLPARSRKIPGLLRLKKEQLEKIRVAARAAL